MLIRDNVLPIKAFELLQSQIVDSSAFPWFKTVTTEEKASYDAYEYSWFHMVLKDGEIASQVYNLIYPLMICAFDNAGEQVNNFLRFRLALQTPIGKPFINAAHVDDTSPHKTAIFYLNTADGNTVIYNETYDVNSNLSSSAYRDNILNNKLTVAREINPVENRLVIFNGLQYHSSQRPISHSCRVVLNINYN